MGKIPNISKMYHSRLDNSIDLSKVNFYDMTWYTKAFNEMFDTREGGYIFRSKFWISSWDSIADREIAIIEGVRYFMISNHYKFNYVYLIAGTHNGVTRYKIGKANSIKDRLSRFEVKIPFDIELICSFSVKNAIELESKLHKHFKDKRLSGEWFDLSVKDLLDITIIGSNKEVEDYYDYLDTYKEQVKKEKRLNDKDYISYLESVLVFSGTKFEARV